MDDASLFSATVPVLRHYIARLDVIVARAGPGDLERRVAEDMFPAGMQFRTAQNFALRTVFPVLARPVPVFAAQGQTAAILSARSAEVLAFLDALTVTDFAGAAARVVRHQAGEGKVEQAGWDYALRFALPNFFFHLTTGYASLRAGGVVLGKADFDGLHHYPPGFRF